MDPSLGHLVLLRQREAGRRPRRLAKVRQELGARKDRQPDFKLHKGASTAPEIATFPLTAPQSFPRLALRYL